MSVLSFEKNFKQDLENIYAKYSKSFHGSPELELSTCDFPENVKLIESYDNNCGRWRTTNEEDSDEGELSDYHSDSSESFENSFQEIYPSSCTKKYHRTSRSSTSASVAKTSKAICQESVDKTVARKDDDSSNEVLMLPKKSRPQMHNNSNDKTKNRENSFVKQKLSDDAHRGHVKENEITAVKALDSGYCSESCPSSTCQSGKPQRRSREASCGKSSALSMKPADQASEVKPGEELPEKKGRPRFRLVRRCSCNIQNPSSHVRSISLKNNDIPVKTAHCSFRDEDEVLLLETSLGEPPVGTKHKHSSSVPHSVMYLQANRSNSLASKKSTLEPSTHSFPTPVKPNTNSNDTLKRKETLRNVAARMDSSSSGISSPEINFLSKENVSSSEILNEHGVSSGVKARLSAKSACETERTPERHPVNNRSVSASPRRQRAKYHPYASCDKVNSTLRDLSLKSQSSKTWKSLDPSPKRACVENAERLRNPVLESTKILQFGLRGKEETPRKSMRSTCKITNVESPGVNSCASTTCTKLFCFDCSMTMDLT